MCKEYNGWANYPTWNVALWLDNDPGLQEMALEIARQDFGFEFERDDAYRELVENIFSEFGTNEMYGMKGDLLGWTLSSVEWRAISDSYKEQVAEC